MSLRLKVPGAVHRALTANADYYAYEDGEPIEVPDLVVEIVQTFTDVDRRLLTIADGQRRVRYTGRPPRNRRVRAQLTLEMRRLDFLASLGLAQRTGVGTWELSPELERTLRQAQLAGDILKSRARHQAHVSDHASRSWSRGSKLARG